jgi:hypothetical protein
MPQLPSLQRRISPLVLFRKRLEKMPHLPFRRSVKPLKNRACHPWPPVNAGDIAKD